MRRSFGLLAFLALAGCAAAPKLADYPRREIDRPLTLPKGLASWSILGEYSQTKYRYSDGTSDSDRYTVGPIPLKWQTSLSDDWNLVWLPIPVGAIYQIRNDASATTGIFFGYGLQISSVGESAFGIGAQYFHRQKLASDFALEFTPSIMPWFALGDHARSEFQASLGVGPFWQVGETISVNGGLRPTLLRNPTSGGDISTIDGNRVAVDTEDGDYRVVYPFYLGMNWSFSRQWDFGGTVNYSEFDKRSEFSRLKVDFEFRHFW